ncbi:MAG: tetratricopeptide repeat protein [Bacteroidetes bacterium]|nr:tetratricopeptide repeat protein [Bacteroidota bacterium]
MKNLKIFAIFLFAAALLSSCGGVNKMVKESDVVGYTVNPTVLEMHGGTVDATITVNYPAKYFNKKATVTLTPVLKYEGGEKRLDPLVLQGQDVTANNKPISFDTGGSATHAISLPYEEVMAVSELSYDIVASMKDKETPIGEVKLADGIKATAGMVSKKAKLISFSDNFEQIVPKTYNAEIKYVINRADVRRSEMGKEEMTGMNETIKTANENERLDMKGIEISAYASPDGELDINTKLADKRQKTAGKYLAGQLKKAKIEVADELMSMLSTPEDWDGFKKLMEASDIQDKEMILRVLSMHSDPVVREQEIKNLSAAFEVIAEEILPQLRRSMFTVNMEKIGWSDDELKELWGSNADTLVLEELLYTATLYEDNETKLAVYSKAAEVAPKCVRAHNNKGVSLFKLGKADEAAAAFDAAKALKDHDNVNNNLGAIALKNDDVSGAKEAFTASLGAGEKVNYNLGIVNLIEGKYGEAINYFGTKPSYNLALATYLNGDNEGAWRIAANLEQESPYRSYLLAVIAANQDKPEVVYENLKSATETCKDPQFMKDHAKKDVEFAKLWNEAAFKAVVE